MKIYIASSWRNEHGVSMLTNLLRAEGYNVMSWIENCSIEREHGFDFETWVDTEQADDCFAFDTTAATECDVFIYYAPAGKDAAAELGAAYGAGKAIILGLSAKGDDLGLMRKMVGTWHDSINQLIRTVGFIAMEPNIIRDGTEGTIK